MQTFQAGAAAIMPGTDPVFPSSLVVADGRPVEIAAADSAFGYAWGGTGRVSMGARAIALESGMFFSIPGPATLEGVSGFVAVRHGYRSLALLGVLELVGRLAYIDGCSDTLLIAPPVMGDPCLNYLHMPAGTRQSQHTHPSVRIGMIAGGSGWCLSPASRQPLAAGLVFILAPGEQHSFHTDGEAMHIVVYHPDSDFGPQAHDHPMINKTILAGSGGGSWPGI